MPQNVVKHEVVALLTFGEVLLRVVDDVVGADRPDQVLLRRAAHAGHLSAERLGDLHGERADASSRADDQDLLPRLDAARVAQRLEGGETGHRNGGRLLERDVGRLGDEVLLRSNRVLGERADATAEDLIPDPKTRHVLADRFDDARQIGAANTELRSAQPEGQPNDVRHAMNAGPVRRVHGGRVNTHEHLVVLGDRLVDVLELHDIR